MNANLAVKTLGLDLVADTGALLCIMLFVAPLCSLKLLHTRYVCISTPANSETDYHLLQQLD